MKNEHDNTAMRLDKWLWAARFFKTRALAQKHIELGRVQVNGAKVKNSKNISAGDTIDLGAVQQLVDPAQTEALARALDRVAELVDGRRSLDDLVRDIMGRIEARGLDWLSPYAGHPGNLARPRSHELRAAINRYRRLGLLLNSQEPAKPGSPQESVKSS